MGSCWPGKIQTVFHNNLNSFPLSPFSFLIHIAHSSVTTSHTSKFWTWCDTWLCSSPCAGDVPSGSASGNLCNGGGGGFSAGISHHRWARAACCVCAAAPWGWASPCAHTLPWLSLLYVDGRPFTDNLMLLITAQSCPNRLADLRNHPVVLQETLIKSPVTDKENNNGVGRNVCGLAPSSAALPLCLCW